MATAEEEKQKEALKRAGKILFRGLTPAAVFRSSYLILLMNIFPVIAVLMFNWQVQSIVYFYVAETMVIGLINVLKILTAQAKDKDTSGSETNIGISGRFGLVLFFLFHYFFFVFIQMQFIIMAVTSDRGSIGTFFLYFIEHKEAAFGLLIVFTSHLISFFTDYIGHGTYKNMSPMLQMFIPYARIFVQQFVGIAGGMVVLAFGSPVALLVLLQIFKTIVDVIAHHITVSKYKELSVLAEENN